MFIMIANVPKIIRVKLRVKKVVNKLFKQSHILNMIRLKPITRDEVLRIFGFMKTIIDIFNFILRAEFIDT